MKQFAGRPLRVLVVWEPVLPTDFMAPSTSALRRIADSRATQFWDRGRLISRSMGERDRRSVVWDFIAIYGPGAIWNNRPPQAIYQGGPVVRVVEAAQNALAQGLAGNGTGPTGHQGTLRDAVANKPAL